MNKYTSKSIPIETSKGTWNTAQLKIYKNDKLLTTLERLFPSNTDDVFDTFTLNKNEYFLFSGDYTTVEVYNNIGKKLKLKGNCQPSATGFCPVNIWVPHYKDECDAEYCKVTPNKRNAKHIYNVDFAFVCGCYWGAEGGGWELKVLDLSKIEQGELNYIYTVPEQLDRDLYYSMEFESDLHGGFNLRYSYSQYLPLDIKSIEKYRNTGEK
ncbi:MAG: hypothetical protein H8E55_41190 [Pelagibacterales bacterium]|nr:hypothetical protein [Pelagibacterales bacterium]